MIIFLMSQKKLIESIFTKKNKYALDIGSNDGSQLKCYKKLGYNVLGIEFQKQQLTLQI